jgi:hypothetical protein
MSTQSLRPGAPRFAIFETWDEGDGCSSARMSEARRAKTYSSTQNLERATPKGAPRQKLDANLDLRPSHVPLKTGNDPSVLGLLARSFLKKLSGFKFVSGEELLGRIECIQK